MKRVRSSQVLVLSIQVCVNIVSLMPCINLVIQLEKN